MLKSLELSGFKSFAEKTEIEFPAGVTTIVGPNGSGKSNIVEAFRFVLGEREAKNIRSEDLSGLIFSGSKKKQGMSAGYASLTLLNHEGKLASDFPELLITRRVYKNGDSECLINNSAMRLKDAVELFAHSRIGARGMMIVNQGEADAFVLSKPLQRRALLEEIFGLKGYRMKGEEAERKLTLTEENIARAEIELEGLLPRLTILRREAERKKKQEDLEKKLTELHLQYFSLIKGLLRRDFFAIKERKEQLILQKESFLKRISEVTLMSLIEQPDFITIEKKISLIKRQMEEKEQEIFSFVSLMEQRIEVVASKTLPVTKSLQKKQENELVFSIVMTAERAIEKGGVTAMGRGLKDIRKMGKEYLGEEEPQELVMKQESQKELDFTKEKEQIANARQVREKLQKELQKIEEEKEKMRLQFREKEREIEKEKDELRETEYGLRELNRQEEEWQKENELYQYELREVGMSEDDFSFDEIGEGSAPLLEEVTRKRKRTMDELNRVGLIDENVLLEARVAEERNALLIKELADIRISRENLIKIIGELKDLVRKEFSLKFSLVKERLSDNFLRMFKDGKVELFLTPEEGVEMQAELGHKGAKSVLSFSGGERSLLGIAALFALASVSAPPFLLFDEVDAPLDERNCRRFAELLSEMKKEMQFILITHNRAVMEAADAIYGVSMTPEGYSRVVSMKL
ncbi:MAG: hypothetical protein FJY91_01790 [Candidatus Harrisonbacteria bacterium]|nr:hypothetical protein [Candidatus Harrisonbacteria bacterium]